MNIILAGDCIENLRTLSDASVDLIFADPPYNMQLRGALHRPDQSKVSAVNDEWDKFSSFAAYDSFCRDWLTECRRILKADGTIWVIGSYHNIYRLGALLQDLDFWILNDVVWVKNNPMPNFKGTRFNNAHETLIWASKSEKSKFTFHYKTMKAYNDDLQMRSDWQIPICSGEERIKVNGEKAHSTQKPEALLYRILLATTNVGDTVLDPFFGSGTTGAVAKRLGRNYIGLEREPFYIEVATQRIAAVEPIDQALLIYPSERKKIKIAFSALLEQGFIEVGETLFSKDKKQQATVLADASLQQGELHGSIHRLSALLLGREANNGWTFWYVEREGVLVAIDDFRITEK
jgi:DNA modification methylase